MVTKSCIFQPTSPASVSSPFPIATLACFNPLNMWCSFQCLGLCTLCSILLTHPANASLSRLSLNFVSSKKPSLITWVPCHMLTWHLNVVFMALLKLMDSENHLYHHSVSSFKVCYRTQVQLLIPQKSKTERQVLCKRKYSFFEEAGHPGEKMDSCPKEPTLNSPGFARRLYREKRKFYVLGRR